MIGPTTPHAVTEDSAAPKRKRSRAFLLPVAGALMLVIGAAVVLTLSRAPRKPATQPTKEQSLQKEYDLQKQRQDDRKASHIQDTPFVYRSQPSQIDIDKLMKEIEKAPKSSSPGQTESDAGGDPELTKREALIASVLKRSQPNQSGTLATRHTFQSSRTRSDSASDPQAGDAKRSMFAYSRSYKKAHYFDAPQAPPATAAKSTKADTASTEAQQTPAIQPAKFTPKPAEPSGKKPLEQATAIIYSRYPAVSLFEGEFLDAVLLNKIVADTEESPVIAAVTKDCYDAKGQYVVIPASTRIIGTSQVVTYRGAHRLFIRFNRMILPNGISVPFPSSQKALQALDETGALGIVSDVNRHFLLQFGAALFVGAIDGLAGFAQNRADPYSGTSFFIDRTSRNFDRILNTIMQRYTSIVPTITVWQGTKMKVYISDDVLITPYALISERSYSPEQAYASKQDR